MTFIKLHYIDTVNILKWVDELTDQNPDVELDDSEKQTFSKVKLMQQSMKDELARRNSRRSNTIRIPE